MSDTFKALLVSRDEDKKQSVDFVELTEADLMEGDVTVAVDATTVNYKDGLAITGNAPVVRVSEVKEGRMMLTIFLWVDDVANRHIARTEYRSNLYQVLGENGVEIAIPRNRVWLNREQVRGP